MYTVNWTLVAEATYIDEINFIELKWSQKQIEEFIILVDQWIKRLESGTITGKPSEYDNVRILVVSKQTSLAYKIFEEESKIELITFWNNEYNPEVYNKYFRP